MTAIQATTAGVKDMADGTLRFSFDVEPRHAQEAYSLFGSRGAGVAIAALTQQATVTLAQAEAIQKAPALTGLALLAVQWCKDPKFWEWLNSKWGDENFFANENDVKIYICALCGIDSRKELHTNNPAASRFNKFIRDPYMKWLKNN